MAKQKNNEVENRARVNLPYWTEETLCGVELPKGARVEDVIATANYLIDIYLKSQEDFRLVKMPMYWNVNEYAASLLEHIDGYAYYMTQEDPDSIATAPIIDGGWYFDSMFSFVGRPKNNFEICRYLNWEIVRVMNEAGLSQCEALIIVDAGWRYNDELMEMPWCESTLADKEMLERMWGIKM